MCRATGASEPFGALDYNGVVGPPTEASAIGLQIGRTGRDNVHPMNSILAASAASASPPSPSRASFDAFIADPGFPCVGAKSALNKKRIELAEYASLTDPSVIADLCARLGSFARENPDPGAVPISFVATFAGPVHDEATFERDLWKLLQAMHDHDRARFAWDPTVGSDPSGSDFSFSIAERAFFVVGLHPHASRLARRSPFPCVVFNFHNQFENLKASGKYQTMQAAIRSRDLALQGSINPVLARFGEASEARQYAGRAVEGAWRCPFHARGAAHA